MKVSSRNCEMLSLCRILQFYVERAHIQFPWFICFWVRSRAHVQTGRCTEDSCDKAVYMYCTVCSYLIFAREFVSKLHLSEPRQTPNHCDKCNLWKSSMEEQFWWNFILISDRSLPRCYYNVLLWYFCTLIDSGRRGSAQAIWPRRQQALLTDQVWSDGRTINHNAAMCNHNVQHIKQANIQLGIEQNYIWSI